MKKQLFESNKVCPKCKNNLLYWISEDYYLKGTKFFECEVCKWTPDNMGEPIKVCKNGCDGRGGSTVCSDCP